jgi:hypothetical protein
MVPNATLGTIRRAALLFPVMLTVVLAGCRHDGSGDTRNPATAVTTIYDASPAPGTPGRGGLPQDADTASVVIRDGGLEPEVIEGRVGMPYVLTVTGDGEEHRLSIDGIVAETAIAPEGDTVVQFTVPEMGTGDHDILLDGQKAGTFRVVLPGGVT